MKTNKMKENNLNKYYVPFDRAEKLRDLGFDQPCINWYSTTHSNVELSSLGVVNPEVVDAMLRNPNISGVKAPLLAQAFDWFRENYWLFIAIGKYENGYSINDLRRFNTYEEAELACLDKLIEMAEEQI